MQADVESILPKIPESQVDISIHVSTTLNVTAVVARRKVNRRVLEEIGTGLIGDDPTLVIEGNRLRWRVPIFLCLPSAGRLGQVGAIDVDVRTGELLANQAALQAIGDHAERLAAGSTL